MTVKDKRSSQRVDVQLSLRARWAETEVTGTTVNVSLGGVLAALDLDPAPKLGDRLTLWFSLPALSEPIEVQAEVRWSSPQGLGLQFATGLRAKQTWALGRFLDKHAAES